MSTGSQRRLSSSPAPSVEDSEELSVPEPNDEPLINGSITIASQIFTSICQF
jgi:hypothetical protein